MTSDERKIISDLIGAGGLLAFTQYMFFKMYHRDYIVGDHHRRIAAALDKVISGETTRLIINMPPRYGKTELAVKAFIAFGMAINPKSKFIHLSYSDDLARDNSKGVYGIVSSEAYQDVFPHVKPTGGNSRKWHTTAGGGLYAVASGGQVTGFGAGQVEEEGLVIDSDGSTFAGAIIIDDPIKPDDAMSDLIREKVNTKFETTIRNRVNSRRTPIVVIMQRLHEKDLCGYLIANEPDGWEVLSLPSIESNEKGEEVPLWEFKHTLDELHRLREINPFVFETQYQQNPTPLEGLLYHDFATYEEIPPDAAAKRMCYIDTADTGSDYLCAVSYVQTKSFTYVTDVLFSKSSMEVTEPQTAQMIARNQVQQCYVESNNGGRAFCRNIERISREINNLSTRFVSFAQTANKQARILANSSAVNNTILMPKGWELRWRDFASQILSFRKEGRNAHDDAPDVLTGIIEKRESAAGHKGVTVR